MEFKRVVLKTLKGR